MAFTHRYIARIVLEAETGLFVGSGEASLLKDALVQKDIHGLPMIQGTSLTGVLRHSFLDNVTFDTFDKHKEFLINLWGVQLFGEEKKAFDSYYKTKYNKNNAPDGFGSRLKISSAYMLINENAVAEGLTANIPQNILDKYTNLPSRQHVRINDRGVADTKDKGLFDNEIVYKGTRFIFELELKGTEKDSNHWNAILENLSSPLFRIGQGTRNGYGKLNIYSLEQRVYNLEDSSDFEAYLNFEPSFNHKNEGFTLKERKSDNSTLTEYKLILTPDSFFIFSEGFGDNEADNKPVTEEIAIYRNGTIEFEERTLIPASSIKGALSHRTAFHYNRLTEKWADKLLSPENRQLRDFTVKCYTGSANDAVFELFGGAAGDEKREDGQRGKVILNDFYYSDAEVENNKTFNHVAIDRFTGGALDGALFSEKVSTLAEETAFEFTVYLDYDKEDTIQEAFEETLKDVCKGLLPLGGMTTKGHGIFTGKVLKGTQTIFDYDSNN